MTVAEVRAFNRFYTRVTGLLRPDLAGSPFGLTEARVLYELAHGDGVAATDLARALDLDAGYLSRILARFTAARLVESEPAPEDRRRRVLRLTGEGRAAFAALDTAQVEAVEAVLAPLDGQRRAEVVSAMRRIRRALGDAPPSGLVLRPPQPGDLGWVVSRHGARYATEHGWDASFEVLVARIVADIGAGGPGHAAWIAELDGERVGCVFCAPAETAGTAQLRLLLVEPAARGHGVGTKLVEECVRFAGHTGAKRIELWTQESLGAARRIYARAGFTLDRTEPHHSFGHDLVGEYWSREL